MDNGASSYRRYLDGDENAFVEIVRTYNDALILYLNTLVNDLSVADELAEDAFVKLGVKKPRFAEKASFKTWLYTIGRNLAIDYLRKNRRNRGVSLEEIGDVAAEEALEQGYLRQEQRIMLHRAMRELKSAYRQVLWLRYFDGFSGAQTARIMKKTVHSTEALLYRAKNALKLKLEKDGFFYEDL